MDRKAFGRAYLKELILTLIAFSAFFAFCIPVWAYLLTFKHESIPFVVIVETIFKSGWRTVLLVLTTLAPLTAFVRTAMVLQKGRIENPSAKDKTQ